MTLCRPQTSRLQTIVLTLKEELRKKRAWAKFYPLRATPNCVGLHSNRGKH
jgi:hypothetical protein